MNWCRDSVLVLKSKSVLYLAQVEPTQFALEQLPSQGARVGLQQQTTAAACEPMVRSTTLALGV